MLQIWGYARAAIANSDTPVGVPLIEDAATVALKEAAAISGSPVDTEEKK
jgi:hypothetical protein